MASFFRILWKNIRQWAESVVQWIWKWFSDTKRSCRTDEVFVTAKEEVFVTAKKVPDQEEPQSNTLEEKYGTSRIVEFLSRLKEDSCDAAGDQLTADIEDHGVTDDRILFLIEEGHLQVSRNLIGKGGYGEVSEAHFTNKHGNVSKMAVKIIDPRKESDWDLFLKGTANELAVLQSVCNPKVNAPHIIQAYSVFSIRRFLFIVMEIAEQGTVYDFIRKFGVLKGPRCKTWFGQISRGLCYLHRLGITHRDLKCDNILITKDSTLKICDFGLVEFWREGILSHTYDGTPGYKAPEVILQTPHNAKAADIWSIGIILHEFLNADIPFYEECESTDLAECPSFLDYWKYKFQTCQVEDEWLTEDTTQFLFQLLEYHPQKRLTIEQVCSHPWILDTEKPTHQGDEKEEESEQALNSERDNSSP